MAVALRSLMVSADFNSTAYQRGMAEKIAADKAGTASSLAVGEALKQTDSKVTSAASGIERLKRQVVAGHAANVAFEKAIGTLNRGLSVGQVTLSESEAILAGLYAKYGMAADGAALMERGQVAIAQSVTALNGKLAEQGLLADEATLAQRRLADEYARAAAAARSAQASGAVQQRYSDSFGIGRSPAVSARDSAGVFEVELSRMEDLARMKASQAGQTFAAELNTRLVSGVTVSARDAAGTFELEFARLDDIARMKAHQAGQSFAAELNSRLVGGAEKSARDSAGVFEVELSKLDDIARLKAQQAGQTFAQELNARLGVGQQGGSARDSAMVFEAAEKDAEQFAVKAAALRGQIDPLSAAQDRLNAELLEYSVLAERGSITTGELASAHALAQARFKATAASLDRVRIASKGISFQQKNLVYQINDVVQSLTLGMPPMQVFLQQGPQIAQIYGPGEGGVGRAFKETASMAGSLVTKFWPLALAAAAVGTAFAGMTYEIGKSTDVDVGFFDVALASVQVLGDYIYGALQPAIKAVSPWFSAVWNAVIAGVKIFGNLIINSFRAGFEDIKFIWNQFPNIIGAAVVGAANAALRATADLVQKGAALIDAFAAKANSVLPESMQISLIGRIDISKAQVKNTYADDLSRAAGDRNANISEIMSSDPLGQYFSDVRDQSIKNAMSDDKKKNGGGSKKESDYERAIRRTKEQTAATEQETKVINLSTYARERQASVQDILTAAQRDGLEIGKAFANAQDLINASTSSLTPALAAERERILGVASAYAKAQADAENAEKAQRKFEEAMEFAKDTTKGFINDFRGALSEGATVWEAFSSAALKALDKIVDKLLDDVLSAIFDVNKAGSGIGGGGGGLLGSLLGSLFSKGSSTGAAADPWAGLRMANGGVFNAAGARAFAKGGAFTNQVVDRPTYFAFAQGAGLMGEAGPEAIMPLRRDASGRLGVSANDNAGQGGSVFHINASTTIQADGADAGAIAQLEARMAARDRDMPERMIQVIRDAQKRRMI